MAKRNDAFLLKREKVSLVKITEDSRIMFLDASLSDDESAKWIVQIKKKINESAALPESN